MRITGGAARGINITTGGADKVRPATDRMREAVFSSLGERVNDARVLDLFAGSGSYGLEAISRGAKSALFVEKNTQLVAIIERNAIAVTKSMGNPPAKLVKVIKRDVLRFESSMQFDLIFMDPPYELVRTHAAQILDKVRQWALPGSTLVMEIPGDMEVPGTGWNLLKRLGKRGANEPSVAILEPVQ